MSQESNLLTKLEQQMSNLEGMTGKRFLEVLSETATEFGWTLKNHRFISPDGQEHILKMINGGLYFETY